MSKTPSNQHAAIVTVAGSPAVGGAVDKNDTPTVPTTIENNDNRTLDDLQDSITIIPSGNGQSPKEGSGVLEASSSPASGGFLHPDPSPVSPVISRDFASIASLSEKRTLVDVDALKAGLAPKDEASGGVNGGPAAPALTNPRMRALKSLVRSSSEPPREKNTTIDLGEVEKGNAPPLNRASASQANIPNRLAGLLEPNKPLKPPPTYKTSLYNIATYSYLNILLVFVPVVFGVHFSGAGDTATFCCAFGAIIPLAALLGFATEELALRVGHALGGLLNATLGNTVELIIAILALVKGELRVVQSAMIGSILSNCLLVLGCCFFAGGIRFHEQIYTIRSAQLNTSMLSISALVIVIPAAYHLAVSELGSAQAATSESDILKLSRGVSFILLFVYAAYLFFQLWTHSYLYTAASVQVKRSRRATVTDDGEPQPPTDTTVLRIPSWHSHSSDDSDAASTTPSSASSDSSDEDGVEHPKLKIQAAILLILAVTALTGVIAEYLVSSIDGLTRSGNISREFVALILLPLVGNAAEHVTAVVVSVKDKLDLSLAVAVGSSIQISLFVIPVLVLLGWAIGQPLDLQFGTLETITLFVSICFVNQAISDGKSNWLEGLSLIFAYLVIALVFFFFPGDGSL